MNKRLSILIIGLACLTIVSCTKDSTLPSADCSTPEVVSFSDDIMPVLVSSCAYAGCHGEAFGSGDFSVYAGVAEKAESGSLLSRVVTSKDMPPTYAPDDKPKELSDCDIELFNNWIAAGYPDN